MSPDSLPLKLKALRLLAFAAHYQDLAERAEHAAWGYLRYLDELAHREAQERQDRRITRLARTARLPRDKTLESLDTTRFPAVVRAHIGRLCEGEFLASAINVCIFGQPGTGKTHVMAAIGHELVRQGQAVLFTPVAALVERRLQTKRDLRLGRELTRLDSFDCLALDDIGYVQQERAETEVLFALWAQRYERKSVMVTSNLVFSQWDQVFKDTMTTAAAVDRIVHHSVILELNVPSYRAEVARRRLGGLLTEAPTSS
jgi:DNA replication protein DnaC